MTEPPSGATNGPIAVLGGGRGFVATLAAGLTARGLETSTTVRGATGVVIVVGGDLFPIATPVVDLDAVGWDEWCEAPLRTVLSQLQSAYTALASSGGHIVLVVPTIGLAGAAGLVPYTAAVEGARAMAKSAARQWAGCGVTVNLLAVPLETLVPGSTTFTGHLSAAATGALPDGNDIAAAAHLLLAPEVRAITGSTLVVDGGSVMAP